jgi:SAM-dependent methyltransferase
MSNDPNFDRVARIYRWAEYLSLGPMLERTRNHFLPQLSDRSCALVLGDGDGRFLARLLRQNPELHAAAIDTSATMLHLLKKRCAFAGNRIQTLQTSAADLIASEAKIIAFSPDLIVTHFFLDCLLQQEAVDLAQHLAAHTSSGTLWLVSDFALPRTRILRPLAALYIRSLYLAFRVLTGLRVTQLPDLQRALSQAGFESIARHDKLFGLVYTQIWRRR